MNTEKLINQNSLVVVACLSFCKTMDTRYQLLNTSRMLVKAMPPDHLLSEAFGKGSDCARLSLTSSPPLLRSRGTESLARRLFSYPVGKQTSTALRKLPFIASTTCLKAQWQSKGEGDNSLRKRTRLELPSLGNQGS